MPPRERTKDVVSADHFVQTLQSSPYPRIDPTKNALPSPYTILIIGASRGIGASIAYAYAQAGAGILILAARASSAQEVQAVEAEIKSMNRSIETQVFAVDVTSVESMENLERDIKHRFKKLDILVYNSGYSGPVVLKVTEGDPRDFQRVFDVNVQGTYLAAHYFIPLLQSSNGAKMFFVVGSFAACIINGHVANTAYCLSKFAQCRLVEFLSEQYGREEDGGILSIAVHPGAVASKMALATTPDSFLPYLTDEVMLCGAFLSWLSRIRRTSFNGRLLAATWDVDELLAKEEEVTDSDLLKWGFRTGNAERR